MHTWKSGLMSGKTNRGGQLEIRVGLFVFEDTNRKKTSLNYLNEKVCISKPVLGDVLHL